MSETPKRSTIYLEAALHRAISFKAVRLRRSISEVINDAVRLSLYEDLQDMAAFDERAREPTLSYVGLLKVLKVR